MNDTKIWAAIIGILVIFALMAVGVVWSIHTATERALQPVEQIAGQAGTQISSLLNTTPTVIPNVLTIVRDVRSLARLETIQYTVEKVITAETGTGVLAPLFQDKLILVAHGVVIAGVDLQKLSPEDISVKDGVVYIKLPPAEVFIATLDNEKSYVYDRNTGLLTKGDINLESEARRVAEREIEKVAVEDGILSIAQSNAENFLTRMLRSLGYQEVIFIQPTPTPGAP